MNDLPTLHDEANNALVRLLSERLSAMRGGAGYFCAPLQEFAGGALVPVDAPGEAGQGSDSGGSESGGVEA